MNKYLSTIALHFVISQELQREIPEQQVHVTTANQHGQALMEKCRPDDVPVVQAQVKEMNDRWKALRMIVMERQQKLEEALLALGQFQLALEELLAWINHTNQSLDKELQQKPNCDVRSIEVEMSKHMVSRCSLAILIFVFLDYWTSRENSLELIDS